MKTIRIYGASDDCIEVEGDFSDEGYAYDKPGNVTLSTGDVFSVVYGSAGQSDATWHVEHTHNSGLCTVTIERAPRDTEDEVLI